MLYCVVILSVLMLDEAHERTLFTDIAIGLLKKVMPTHSSANNPFKSNFKLFILSIAFKSSHKLRVPRFPFVLRPSFFVVPSLDSEEAARPEADRGLSHSGRQGDCIIKMNRYAWVGRKEKQRDRNGKSWCQVRSHCTDICDTLMKQRHNQARSAHNIKQVSWSAISEIYFCFKKSFMYSGNVSSYTAALSCILFKMSAWDATRECHCFCAANHRRNNLFKRIVTSMPNIPIVSIFTHSK